MKLVIAAGGTGGHLFPGIAIAEELIAQESTAQILFIGTGKGLETHILSREGYPYKTINAVSLRGKSPLSLLWALLRNLKALFQSMIIIKRFSPDLVLGLGGYTSGPVLLAAILLGVTTALHEQNTIPGLTNKILGRMVKITFVSFESTRSFFPPAKTLVVGNPVRKQGAPVTLLLPPPSPFTLLVIGGSLGSHQLNRAMTAALSELLPLRDELHIIHQTGNQDFAAVHHAYQQWGFTAEVVPFIDYMAEAYRRAHLVICRAGATTLAELMLHHKPSILIPYPLATDRHQHLNAQTLVEQKAARMIDPEQLTGSVLARLILHLHHHPEELSEMGENAGALARPHAAKEIVEHITKLIKKEQCTTNV